MKDGLCQIFNFKDKSSFEILEEFPGKKLVGLEYEPLYPFFVEWKEKGAFKVYYAN
jgi:isoleucyl-tRNA synthetase